MDEDTFMSAAHRSLNCSGKEVMMDKTRIMGILNVTPDSFSDGGLWQSPTAAIEHALTMQEQGADIIDVGGESTRPGAAEVSLEEELSRTIPVIAAIAPKLDIPVSIDTSKPEVMRQAVAAGAGMINDVYALRQPGALQMAAELRVPVCLMHMQGEPGFMQADPSYQNVTKEVLQFLLQRAADCEKQGIAPGQIVLDPGFGFGKELEHNLALFKGLVEIVAAGYPILAGLSRKTMIGQLTGKQNPHRMPGSITAAVMAAMSGVAFVRVHDVAETRDALKVATALSNFKE
jgi:dihydropteroate synthase